MNSNQIQPSHKGREKWRDFKCSGWEIKENRQELDNSTTRDQYFVAPYLFLIRRNVFVSPIQGWLSSSSVSLPISIVNFGWTETFLIPTKDFFLSSVPKLTFLRLGYFGNFFFSSDLERLENHKATCLRAFGGWFRGENGKLLFFRYRRGQFVFVDVFTSISLIVHSVFCKR